MNGTYAALAVPNFRRYVAGQSLSLIGTWVETVAQVRLVLRLTHSGTILGLTTAAATCRSCCCRPTPGWWSTVIPGGGYCSSPRLGSAWCRRRSA
jgi:hypothetical protein